MTNNPDPALSHLEDDLTEAFAATVPDLSWETPRALDGSPRGFLRRHWRPGAAIASIAAAVGAFLLVPSFAGDATTVNAQDIFDRASATASFASDAAPSYHVVATWEVQGGGSASTETWYADESHVRMSNGDFGTIRDGEEVWMYLTSAGVVRVAHGPASALAAYVPGGAAGGTSLAAVLDQYGEDNCQQARLEGDAIVAGRAAHVIRVSPFAAGTKIINNRAVAPESCGDNSKAAALAASAGYITLAVDKETFLTLEMQSHDGAGATISHYRVTVLETNIEIPGSVFAYEPPSGALVSEVTSNTEAKTAITGIAVEPSTKSTASEGKEPNVEISKP